MTPTEAHEWLWREGWLILAENYSWSEQKARTLVGSWIKRHGPQLTRRAIVGIQDKKPIDPISWASAGFKAIHAKTAKLNEGGRIPKADLPPQVPLNERVDPDRFAELRAILEE